MNIRVGQKAPDFKLPDQNGKIHKLSDYRGQWLLLYFYPKDDTPGCTKEACGIRDNYASFGKLKTAVLGISIDSVGSHAAFAKKYKLSFPLLADEKKEAVKKYGAWKEKNMMGHKYMGTLRSSFLIDPTGKIVKIYAVVKPEEHADAVLIDIKNR